MMKNLNHLIVHTLRRMQNFLERYVAFLHSENTPIKIYVNNIKNNVMFRVKMGYFLKLLSSYGNAPK